MFFFSNVYKHFFFNTDAYTHYAKISSNSFNMYEQKHNFTQEYIRK